MTAHKGEMAVYKEGMTTPNRDLNMSKKEKKWFLSNDLTERMIRTEQRVSAHFRKPVGYQETEYYKSMTHQQRTGFEAYLKKRKRRKYLFGSVFALSLLLLFIFRLELSGRVVQGSIDSQSSLGIAQYLVVFLVIASVIVVAITRYVSYKRSRAFDSHALIINSWLAGNLLKDKNKSARV